MCFKANMISLNAKKLLPLVFVALPLATLNNGEKTDYENPVITEMVDNPALRVTNTPRFPSPKILDGLEAYNDTNFVGGVSHRYTDESVQKLKYRIMKPQYMIHYESPIKNTSNVYTEPFGYFFANRPTKDGQKRPHLGLDIFTTKYATKPKEPVVIQSPIDGVVISQKKARKKDNVISNAITILGVDGRRYSLDHMAKETDYKTNIPLPELGTIIHAGDEIGYVGSTGETTMWHLHLIVMTDEQLEKQKHSKMWQDLAKNDYCPLRGQVNPLNKDEAGPIADCLTRYRGAKPDITGNYKK